MREPRVFFIDDKTGKPIRSTCSSASGQTPPLAIQRPISRCWSGPKRVTGARLMMLVLHDDPQREYAYGPAGGLPDTKVGTFTRALYDEAKAKG
jgi:hypothetical protein